MADVSTGPKCSTCALKFDSIEAMRKHYDTEFHLNNVRLRVEGKAPLSQNEFRFSVQATGEDDEGASGPLFSCKLCKKSFRSVQTLQSHVKSTAHLMKKEERIIARDSDAASMLTSTSLGSAAMGLHRRHKTHHQKAAAPRHVDPAQRPAGDDREEDVSEVRCLFCGLLSDTMEDNLDHLLRLHQFSIPLRHRCTDVKGLLQYLARKVNGLMCLTCGLSTKSYPSLSALRDHMHTAGHDRLVLTTEYNEFYSNTLDDLEAVDSNATTQTNELVVLDGARTVFRRDARGLFQRHRETEAVQTERRALLTATQEANAVMKKERLDAMRPDLTRQAKELMRREERFYSHQLKVSMRANKLHPKGYDGEGEVN